MSHKAKPFVDSFSYKDCSFVHQIIHSADRLLDHFGIYLDFKYTIKNAKYIYSNIQHNHKTDCIMALKTMPQQIITLKACATHQNQIDSHRKATFIMITKVLHHLFGIDFNHITLNVYEYQPFDPFFGKIVNTTWSFVSSGDYVLQILPSHCDNLIRSIHHKHKYQVQIDFMNKLCDKLESYYIDNIHSRIPRKNIVVTFDHDYGFAEKAKSQIFITMHSSNPNVIIKGSECTTTKMKWVNAMCDFGCISGKVMYEVYIKFVGSKCGLCRFGFGTQHAVFKQCGTSMESFGFGGTGEFSHNNQVHDFGESFTMNDTICCAVNFETKEMYFSKNGRLLRQTITMNRYLCNKELFPMISFKNSKVIFNFGALKKPCKFLIDLGFVTMEQLHNKENIKHAEIHLIDDVDKDDIFNMKMRGKNRKKNGKEKKDLFEKYTVNGIGGKLLRLSGWNGTQHEGGVSIGAIERDVNINKRIYTKKRRGLGALVFKYKNELPKRPSIFIKSDRLLFENTYLDEIINALPQKGQIKCDKDNWYFYIKLDEEWTMNASHFPDLATSLIKESEQYKQSIKIAKSWSEMTQEHNAIVDAVSPPAVYGMHICLGMWRKKKPKCLVEGFEVRFKVKNLQTVTSFANCIIPLNLPGQTTTDGLRYYPTLYIIAEVELLNLDIKLKRAPHISLACVAVQLSVDKVDELRLKYNKSNRKIKKKKKYLWQRVHSSIDIIDAAINYINTFNDKKREIE